MNKEYINPIDNIINKLQNEMYRRMDAINSGYFCDNDVMRKNVKVLMHGILEMKDYKGVFIQEGE